MDFPDNLMAIFGYKRINMNDVIHIFIGAGPQVGKTTMAKHFAQQRGLKHGSTSDVVVSKLAYELSKTDSIQANPDHCWMSYEENILKAIKENKQAFRWLLEAVGDRICRDDPCGLGGALIEQGCTVIDGVRRWQELHALMAKYSVEIHWVSRKGWPKVKDNTDIKFEDYAWDHLINNNYQGE